MQTPLIKNISKEAFLAKFPLDQLWRFFVDGLQQKNGWKNFEDNEPGYLVGTYTAFLQECCSTHFEEPLSASVLVRIHHCAVSGVRHTNYDKYGSEKVLQGRFREKKVKFGLSIGDNVSPDGYREILRLSKEHPQSISIYDEALHGQANDTERDVNRILRQYHHDLRESISIEDKIKSIIKMVTELERIHPFLDGNCRSICMLTVMRESLKLNLYPPIVDDPNQYDGFSQQELYQKFIKGMQRTYDIAHFGFTTIPFEKTMISHKGRSSKMYESHDFKSTLESIFNYKVLFSSETQFSKFTRSKRLVSNEEKDHDFLLKAVFFEAWSVVEKMKIFRDEGMHQVFNHSLNRYHKKYVEEMCVFSNIIQKTNSELSASTLSLSVIDHFKLDRDGDFPRPDYSIFQAILYSKVNSKVWGGAGVVGHLIDLNCQQTIMQLFKNIMIHPALYMRFKEEIFMLGRPEIEAYIDETMISTFVTLYTGRENKQLNKVTVKIFWDMLNQHPFVDNRKLKEKVFLALSGRGYEIGKFPELNNPPEVGFKRKRKMNTELRHDTEAESSDTPRSSKKLKRT